MLRAIDIPTLAADFLQGCMKGETKINLDLHVADDLSRLLRRLVRNIVMGLWVMALLISSSIICTTDMKPKLWGIPALGAFGYVFAFIIVLYVFIKHFFSGKNKDGDHLQSLRDGFRLFLLLWNCFGLLL